MGLRDHWIKRYHQDCNPKSHLHLYLQVLWLYRIRRIDSKIVEIVSQNHGFCVDFDSLDSSEVRLSHLNLNDKTCEGIEDEKLNLLSVQYHPEASPGPHDSAYLFTQFTKMMEKSKTLSGTDARV